MPGPFSPPSKRTSRALDGRCLVSTDWLSGRLGDPSLRLFDATVARRPATPGAGGPCRYESGREGWRRGHIPGADFLDLTEELAAPAAGSAFGLPTAAQFAQVMAEHGIGEDTYVVLYDADRSAWASRVWWVLRAYGFGRAAVLDGGWAKWAVEGRPTSDAPARYRRGASVARPKPGFFASRDDVRGAIDGRSALLVGAHAGDPCGRPGPSAPASAFGGARLVELPADELVEPSTHEFAPAARLRERLERAGATRGARVITYCDEGVGAYRGALALTRLGLPNVSVYEGPLAEKAA